MALDPFWTAERQFARHRPGRDRPPPFGLLPAIFVARMLDGQEREFEADLDYRSPDGAPPAAPSVEDAMAGRPARQGPEGVRLIGVQWLCPRCQMPCYVPTSDHPEPRTAARSVEVHWDRPMRSAVDGRERPTFTVRGDALVCDYLSTEITGVAAPTAMRCGWRGRIEAGRAIDDSPVRGSVFRTGA